MQELYFSCLQEGRMGMYDIRPYAVNKNRVRVSLPSLFIILYSLFIILYYSPLLVKLNRRSRKAPPVASSYFFKSIPSFSRSAMMESVTAVTSSLVRVRVLSQKVKRTAMEEFSSAS